MNQILTCAHCSCRVTSETLRLLVIDGAHAVACHPCVTALGLSAHQVYPAGLPEPLERFLAGCHYSPGRLIRAWEFYTRFVGSLPECERDHWTWPVVVGTCKRDFPSKYPVGRYHDSLLIGNLSWQPRPPASKPFVLFGDRLRRI